MKKSDDNEVRQSSGLFLGSEPLHGADHDRRAMGKGDDDGTDVGGKDGGDSDSTDKRDTDSTDKGDGGEDSRDSDGKD